MACQVLAQRVRLLSASWKQLGPEDHLLLGTDLVKDAGGLVAACDDDAGVTAAFNRNVLAVINREPHATFDPRLFDHHASHSIDSPTRVPQVVDVDLHSTATPASLRAGGLWRVRVVIVDGHLMPNPWLTTWLSGPCSWAPRLSQ